MNFYVTKTKRLLILISELARFTCLGAFLILAFARCPGDPPPPPPPGNPNPGVINGPACPLSANSTLNDTMSGSVLSFVAMDLYARSYSPIGARKDSATGEYKATIYTDAMFQYVTTFLRWTSLERINLFDSGYESFAMSANNHMADGLVAGYRQATADGPLLPFSWKRTGVSGGVSTGVQVDLPLGGNRNCVPTTSTDSEAMFGFCNKETKVLEFPVPQVLRRPGDVYANQSVHLETVKELLLGLKPEPVRWSGASPTAELQKLTSTAAVSFFPTDKYQYGVVADANDGRYMDGRFTTVSKPTVVVGYGLTKEADPKIRPYLWSIDQTSGKISFVDLYDLGAPINVYNTDLLPPGLDFNSPHDFVLLGSNDAGLIIGYIQFRETNDGIVKERVPVRVTYDWSDSNLDGFVQANEAQIQIFLLSSKEPGSSAYRHRNFILTALPPSYGTRAGGVIFDNNGDALRPIGYEDGAGMYALPNTDTVYYDGGPTPFVAKSVAAMHDNGALVTNGVFGGSLDLSFPLAAIHTLSTLALYEINPGQIPNLNLSGDRKTLGFKLGKDGSVIASFGGETTLFRPQNNDPSSMEATKLTDGGVTSNLGGTQDGDLTAYFQTTVDSKPRARRRLLSGTTSEVPQLLNIIPVPPLSVTKSILFGAGIGAGDVAGMVYTDRWRAFASANASVGKILSDPPGVTAVTESVAFARSGTWAVGNVKRSSSGELATVWNSSTGVGTSLGTLSGDTSSSAVAIAATGSPVMAGGWSEGGDLGRRGFVISDISAPSMTVYGRLSNISLDGHTKELPSSSVNAIDGGVIVGQVNDVDPGQLRSGINTHNVGFISSAEDVNVLVDINRKINPEFHYDVTSVLDHVQAHGLILAIATRTWVDSNSTVRTEERLVLITPIKDADQNGLCG